MVSAPPPFPEIHHVRQGDLTCYGDADARALAEWAQDAKAWMNVAWAGCHP